MSTETTILQTRGVIKRFSGFTAVAGVSLTLAAGERRALIGPNGAGKTTLFNLICGRLRADSGQVLFCGRPIENLPPHAICRLGIARTFQITSIYQQLSALQNIQVALFATTGESRNLLGSGAKVQAAQAMSLLADVGLEQVAGRESGLLSYGDQKRLELAIALALKPRVLLLDEPTAGMEANARRQMVGLVRRVCDENRLTLLFCEHDMESVFSIADRITVLHQGQILAEGSPEEVRRSEAVRATYLGSQYAVAQ